MELKNIKTSSCLVKMLNKLSSDINVAANIIQQDAVRAFVSLDEQVKAGNVFVFVKDNIEHDFVGTMREFESSLSPSKKNIDMTDFAKSEGLLYESKYKISDFEALLSSSLVFYFLYKKMKSAGFQLFKKTDVGRLYYSAF